MENREVQPGAADDDKRSLAHLHGLGPLRPSEDEEARGYHEDETIIFCEVDSVLHLVYRSLLSALDCKSVHWYRRSKAWTGSKEPKPDIKGDADILAALIKESQFISTCWSKKRTLSTIAYLSREQKTDSYLIRVYSLGTQIW